MASLSAIQNPISAFTPGFHSFIVCPEILLRWTTNFSWNRQLCTCVTRNSSNRAQKSDLNVPTREWTKVRKERKNFTTRIILTTLKRRPTRRSRRARRLLFALPVVSPASGVPAQLLNHGNSTRPRLIVLKLCMAGHAPFRKYEYLQNYDKRIFIHAQIDT